MLLPSHGAIQTAEDVRDVHRFGQDVAFIAGHAVGGSKFPHSSEDRFAAGLIVMDEQPAWTANSDFEEDTPAAKLWRAPMPTLRAKVRLWAAEAACSHEIGPQFPEQQPRQSATLESEAGPEQRPARDYTTGKNNRTRNRKPGTVVERKARRTARRVESGRLWFLPDGSRVGTQLRR